MSAIKNAMRRAQLPLDWSYPCLVWVGEYLEEATGRPHLREWAGRQWDEMSAKRALVLLAEGGEGECAVERALDVTARREGWVPAEGPMQGAVMIGVYRGLNTEGTPAIFDGRDRWIAGRQTGGFTTIGDLPARLWEVPNALA